MNTTTAETLEQINLKTIAYVVSNHRKTMDETKLRELADSITAIGVQQPIKVCRRGKKNVMIFGHRRATAAGLAGNETVPAIVVAGWDDQQIAEAQVIENILREDLNPVEEAHCVKTLLDAGSGIDAVASKMNKSIDWCRERTDLLRLDDKVQAMVVSGRLPLKHARLIARVGDKKHQANLANSATAGGYGYQGKDYLQPLGDLRKQISWILCKLGAARWPKDVDYAGKRPCDGCVDNTNSEPALFDGIDLTSKKGNCTNLACFEAKGRAWEKDPVKIARDAKREAAKKAKGTGEKAHGQLAPGAKAGESYEAREKRVAGLKRKFPWTPQQALAAGLWSYGQAIIEKIGDFIERGVADIARRPTAVLAISAIGRRRWGASVSGIPTLAEIAKGKTGHNKGIADTWRLNADMAKMNQPPGITHNGEINNCPLDKSDLRYIGDLEAIANAWKIPALPGRPTPEAIAATFAARAIVKAKRPDAAKAIAECQDPELLKGILADGAKPKWKKKAIEDRLAELVAASDRQGESTFDVDTCVICGCTDDHACDGGCYWWNNDHTVCSKCIKTITQTPKSGMAYAIEAINKAPLRTLKVLESSGLSGDWRRKAAAKQIKKLNLEAATSPAEKE